MGCLEKRAQTQPKPMEAMCSSPHFLHRIQLKSSFPPSRQAPTFPGQVPRCQPSPPISPGMASSLYSSGLQRSDSAALLRANSISSSSFYPALPRVARSESVPDVTGYFRPFERNRPLWLSTPYQRPVRLRQQYPFRRERSKQMTEMYWRDRYYFFSPLYKRAESGYRRPFDSEYGTHIYSYWARYNGYGYDRQHPGFNRCYYYPIGDYFG